VTVLGCKDCCAKHKCTYLFTYLVTAYGCLEDQEQQFFYNYNEIRALEKCWIKRISVAGVYVEKWQNTMGVSRS